MMGTKDRTFSPLPREISLEDLVPKDHFYRRLEERLDLSFVREIVAPLYSKGGRPSVDPVVFFRLQLVMFFEGARSERELMRVAADRLSVRWYLGYDLFEPLPDHSSLTCIRERYGLEVFRRFFELVVELCVEAGLVWGEELFFDSTRVKANAANSSLVPNFAAEKHLGHLFQEDAVVPPDGTTAHEETEGSCADAALPTAGDEGLLATNAARTTWIASAGRRGAPERRPNRKKKGRTVVSLTDPDACLTGHNNAVSRLGYRCHYVVDGGKARVILSALVTRGDAKDDRPMLDLLWRSAFRWRLRPQRVTGVSHFGTLPNIRAVEEAGIRAYMPVTNFPRKNPGFFGKEEFLYDEGLDAYRYPNGELLRPTNRFFVQGYTRYRAEPAACNACPLKAGCTDSDRGRTIARDFGERYLERVRSYRGTYVYEKAMRKRRVWVEPLFAEAKDRHGMRRFRLRRLEKVNQEALMIAAGQNVKRLLGFGGRGPRKIAQSVALRPPKGLSLHRSRLRHGAWQGRSSTGCPMR